MQEVFGTVLLRYLSYDLEISNVNLSYRDLALDVLKVDSRLVVTEKPASCQKMTQFTVEASSWNHLDTSRPFQKLLFCTEPILG